MRIQIQKPFHLIVDGYGRSTSYLSNAILWLERPKKDRPKVLDPKYSIGVYIDHIQIIFFFQIKDSLLVLIMILKL